MNALESDRPVRDKPLREAFKLALHAAGLKPIKMYNLRHSFGTSLAAKGVDVRTIQALMRHARLNTTEQYMAYWVQGGTRLGSEGPKWQEPPGKSKKPCPY